MNIATYLVAGLALAFVSASGRTRSRVGFLCTERTLCPPSCVDIAYPIIFWTPFAPMHFLDNRRSVRQLTHLSRSRPLKSGDIDLALGGGIEKVVTMFTEELPWLPAQ